MNHQQHLVLLIFSQNYQILIFSEKTGRAALKYYRGRDWLNQSMKDVIDQNKPSLQQVDESGNVSKDALGELVCRVFPLKQQFYNFYQLHQSVQRYAGHWGFDVAIHGRYIECSASREEAKSMHQLCLLQSSGRQSQVTKKSIVNLKSML